MSLRLNKGSIFSYIFIGSFLLGLFSLLSLSSFAASSDRNKPLLYQGRLTDSTYVPSPDATYTMSFAIYDAATNGTCLWATGANETSGSANCSGIGAVSVALTRGNFSVELGDNASAVANMPPMNLDFNSTTYYLEVKVNTETLSPRTKLAATPYAYTTDELVGLSS